MRKPKKIEEIRIGNPTLENRIIEDVEKFDILYICAPIGWGKYAFLVGFCYENGKNVYWLEETAEYLLEQQIADLPQVSRRIIIIPRLEKIVQNGKLEIIQKLISEKKKGDVFILSSEVPIPQELLPYTMFYKVKAYGIEDLKPSNKLVGQFFQKKGLRVKEETIGRIEQDFNNMPLCIYMLGNLLADSAGKYSNVVREQCYEDIYAYLDVMLFRKLKVSLQEQLLRISCLESFDETAIADMLSISVKQGREVLQQLVQNGSILVPCQGGWQFEPLFERYLSRVRHKYMDTEDIRNMYSKAMSYAEEQKKWEDALRYAYILETEEQMALYLEKFLFTKIDYSIFVKLEVYFQAISLFCLMRHPLLMISKSLMEAINGDLAKAEKYELMFEKYVKQIKNPGERAIFEAELTYLRLLRMGKVNLEEIKELLIKVKEHADRAVTKDGNRFETAQLSVLHGEKDYCDVLINKQYGVGVFEELRRLTAGVMDNVFNIMYGFAEAEVLYEQNKLDQALNLLSRTLWEAGAAKNLRMQQIATITMADLLLARNQLDDVEEFFTQKVDVSEEQGLLFADNVAAHQVYFYLLNNEKENVLKWLRNRAPDEKGRFAVVHYYQYLMKAKVYMWMGSYVLANLILNTLQEFAENYSMRYLEMKVKILKAVIYYKEGNEFWREELLWALEYAEKIHFVRVFADEGVMVYELLQEVAHKESKWADNAYFKEVLTAVRAHMLQYPLYMKQQTIIDIDEFSSHEKEIMKLLASGDKNADIAKKIFVSENTVKYHLKNIYQKLDVKSRGQAINKIKEYNLV